MSVHANSKFPRFMKTLVDNILGLLLFACIALMLLIVLSLLILKVENIPLTASVPVILLLAQVWSYGLETQHDQELTI